MPAQHSRNIARPILAIVVSNSRRSLSCGRGGGMDTALPPGQRAIDDFPRFGVPAYANRLPRIPSPFELRVGEEGSGGATIALDDFNQLQRREIVADFHCVTTWTRRALTWSGYAFRDFYETLFVPRAQPRSSYAYLEFRALDGYTTCVLLEDLLENEVLLADRLQGAPIPLDHGAPLRLIAPQLYGYKSVKHVCAIGVRAEYRRSFADRQTFAHPRGRVALEERGRGLPGRLYRFIYRPLITPSRWIYGRAERRR